MNGHPGAWGNVNRTMDAPRDWRESKPRLARRERQSVYDNIPESYADAVAMLRGKARRNLGYATHLESGSGVVYLVHYETAIVKYYADESVVVNAPGYHTPTTKARINAALGGSTWRIWSDGRGGWAWCRNGETFCEFVDADRVYLEPGRPGRDGIFELPEENGDDA